MTESKVSNGWTANSKRSPTEETPPQAGFPADIARLRELALSNSNSAEPYHNLALALGRMGLHDEALANFHRALEIEPLSLQVRLDLASSCHQSGNVAGAIRHLIETVRLFPQSAQAQRMLGNVLREVGKLDHAVTRYKEALRLQPDGGVYFSLGVVLSQLRRFAESAQAYRDAIALDPSISGAHNNLGTIQLDLENKLPEAIASFQQAIRSSPDCDAAHRNLGVALARQGRHDDAIHAFRAALRLNADNHDALMGLGTSLRDSGRPAESLACFHEVLRLRPDWPEAHNDLAIALVFLNRLDEAIIHFNRTLELKPDHPTARRNRGLAWLSTGDFEQGWPDHEHRAGTRQPPGRQLSQPLWDGSPLNGRTILIFHEQGFGDTIQFVRYVSFVKQTGGKVIFECPRRMIKLLRNCPGIDQVVAQKEPLPPFDVHASVMSLPFLLWHSLKTIPADTPYLFPDKTMVGLWARALSHISGFKVAIVWQGNPRFQGDRHRSFPLHHFAALAKIPGVCLISLQQDKGAEQLASAHFPVLGSWRGHVHRDSEPF